MDTPAILINRTVGVQRRVVIERVDPEVDAGRFPIKRCVGDSVRVRADIFVDGHDQMGVRLLYRRFWQETVEAKGWPDDTLTVVEQTLGQMR